jgi:L-lysine 2,3-aminomutase
MTLYHVTAERGIGPVWVFQCTEVPGALSQGHRLADADSLMREAIAWVAGVDPSTVEIDMEVRLPADLQHRAVALRALSAEVDEKRRTVAAESRDLAKELAETFGGADAARILGISPQRVSQLVRS